MESLVRLGYWAGGMRTRQKKQPIAAQVWYLHTNITENWNFKWYNMNSKIYRPGIRGNNLIISWLCNFHVVITVDNVMHCRLDAVLTFILSQWNVILNLGNLNKITLPNKFRSVMEHQELKLVKSWMLVIVCIVWNFILFSYHKPQDI